MLVSGVYPLILQSLAGACNHRGHHWRSAAEGSVPIPLIVRVGQSVRYRRKIRIEAIFSEISANCLSRRICSGCVTARSNIRHRSHIGQLQLIRHPGDTAALFIHSQEKRLGRITGRPVKHFLQLFCGLNLLLNIYEAPYRIFLQALLRT